MTPRIYQEGLPWFLLLSAVLHLIFLTDFGVSSSIVTARYLGQPVLSVQLQATANAHKPPSSKTAASYLTSEKTTADLRSTSHVAEHPADALPSAAVAHNTAEQHEQPPTAEAGARNQLLGQLQTHLSRYLVYPPLARQRGWEGTVLLGLRVESDGHLDKIRIERSSGYAVLDHSALNSVNRLGQLAEVSAWLNGRGMDMQLPVIYRLIEN